jgi:S1-C subfamily serine protease
VKPSTIIAKKNPSPSKKPNIIAKRTSRPTEIPDKVISASSGSGFAVSSNGYVITNNHVIDGCKTVKIHHKGKSIPATVVTYDPPFQIREWVTSPQGRNTYIGFELDCKICGINKTLNTNN